MGTNSADKIRKNGIYYTPSHIAGFLAKPLLNKDTIKIFDPAYGEGALLLAAESILHNDLNIEKFGALLYGCDSAPLNGLLRHLPDSNLVKSDFFDYPFEQKFDVILMNPPYVRHHRISNTKRTNYQKAIASSYKPKTSSDLWVYFLVKAVGHLKTGGSIGAILPWSLLQAEYAQDLRRWLAERFLNIKVLALGADYFDEAQERIVMVWLHNFSLPVDSIKISFSQHVNNQIEYSELTRTKWESQSVLFSKKHNIEMILDKYVDKYQFKNFEQVADVKIGVVTGCDDFFILRKSDIDRYGFSEKNLIPILTSSKDFCGLSFDGDEWSKYLLLFLPGTDRKYFGYISKGIRAKHHLRAHSTRRKPWYRVNVGKIPDAFFPYRASQIPYLVMNTHGIQCTNSIHRIYFKGLSNVEIKWIQISLLSVPGQLSIEAYSKNYGSGMLKIEPSSLKKAIVYQSDNHSIDSIYERISKTLSAGHKIEAVKMATVFINTELGISKEFAKEASGALEELQKRRLERNS